MADYDLTRTTVATGGGGNLPATNELPVDMHRKQFEAFPALTPMLSMLSRMADESATNFRVDWQTANSIPIKVVVAQAVTSGGTTVNVTANGPTVVQDSVLFNPRTYDYASVSATPTTNAITVVRGANSSTAAAWNEGDVLDVLPPSLAENDETYRAVAVADTNDYNYTQIVKVQYGLTRVMDKTSTHFGGPGSKRTQLKQQKYREFREKHQSLLIVGGRASTGTAPATIRRSGGLVHYLRDGTLFEDFGGTLSKSSLDNFIGDYHDQNPDVPRPLAFVAPNVRRIVNGFADTSIRVSPESTRFGIDIQTYIGGPVSIDLIEVPQLSDPVERGWGFLIDPTRITLKTLDRATFYPDAKNVGESEIIYDTYRVVTTLLLANEAHHAMFVGALA